MKKDIHPTAYRTVVFKDVSNEETFLTFPTFRAFLCLLVSKIQQSVKTIL